MPPKLPEPSGRSASKPRRLLLRFGLALLSILVAGLLLPERVLIPVAGATPKDWHPKSFWYEPWGISGVHKGIDIFAPRGQQVRAAVPGVVVFRGTWAQGGKVVAVLGPKWRLHYYAHLEHFGADPRRLLAAGSPLGAVGTTGNAAGKAPHLHYAVVSLLPMPWRYSSQETQGWRKMFYLDPDALLKRKRS